ncbi:hypothetical protein ACWD00_11595 [Streptomyces viridiviolaceus]
MPEEKESGHRLAGRLYATLRVLKHLGAPAGAAPVEEVREDKTGPAERIRDLRSEPFRELLAVRGNGRREAAVELFRSLPDLLPPQGVPTATMNPQEIREFAEGHRAQLTDIKEKFPGLLK